MFGKRTAFWFAVAGVSILAQFGAELVSDKFPALGLQKFVAYSHKGHPTNAAAA